MNGCAVSAVAAGSPVQRAHLDVDAQVGDVRIGQRRLALVELGGVGLRHQESDRVGVLAGEGDVRIGELRSSHLEVGGADDRPRPARL